jgi:transcriptional regulator with XRE-family HTH domain
MNDATQAGTAELANKISRLMRERGWNQEDLARNARLNRQTIRQILSPGADDRRLRNATIAKCAKALDLTVTELLTVPLERLLARLHADAKTDGNTRLRRLYEQATQPELLAWMERNPERAKQLSTEEVDELLSLQGTGGPLTTLGVEHYVGQIERKRTLHQKVSAIAGTEYLDLLEKLVDLMYDKVQPYGNRT